MVPLAPVQARVSPSPRAPGREAKGAAPASVAAGRSLAAARHALFSTWQARQPLRFDAFYNEDGILRRDVAYALWERIEKLALRAHLAVPETSTASATTPAAAPVAATAVAGVQPDNGGMTIPELRDLIAKLSNAERVLGKQHRAELSALRALREQALGAWAAHSRPDMQAEALEAFYGPMRAGMAQTFRLKADASIPGLPVGVDVSPTVGVTHASGLEVSDDLWIREGRRFEVRLGVAARLKAYFFRLRFGAYGMHSRGRARCYRDAEHMQQAPDSNAYHLTLPRSKWAQLTRAAMAHHGAGFVLPRSMAGLDSLRDQAFMRYGAFTQAAAMLGVVIGQASPVATRHPLSASHAKSAGTGTPTKTVATGLRLNADASLDATGQDGIPSWLMARASADTGVQKQTTGLSTYVPFWVAIRQGKERGVDEATTAARIGRLREALPPLARAQRLHGPQASAGVRAAGATDIAQVLDTIASWQPGKDQVPASVMNATLERLALELDLYCSAVSAARNDTRVRPLVRSIERAWGIEPEGRVRTFWSAVKRAWGASASTTFGTLFTPLAAGFREAFGDRTGQGAYGLLRAYATAATMLDQHARETAQEAPVALEALTARLAAPPMIHDGALLKRATGFEDRLNIATWEADIGANARAGVEHRYLGGSAGVSGRAKASHVEHFNMLRSGNFVELEVGVDLTGNVNLRPLASDFVAMIVELAPGAAAYENLIDTVTARLGDAFDALGLNPGLHAGARLLLRLRYSQPLACASASGSSPGMRAEKTQGVLDFNLEHIRVLKCMKWPAHEAITPLAETVGKDGIRYVLTRLDNCYTKDNDLARGDREAREYLALPEVRRDLPDLYMQLGKEDSGARRQVRAFVRAAIAHTTEEAAARALEVRRDDLFHAMKAYAQAAQGVAAGVARGVMPEMAATADAHAAAEEALLAFTKAMLVPAHGYRDRRTTHATTLSRPR